MSLSEKNRTGCESCSSAEDSDYFIPNTPQNILYGRKYHISSCVDHKKTFKNVKDSSVDSLLRQSPNEGHPSSITAASFSLDDLDDDFDSLPIFDIHESAMPRQDDSQPSTSSGLNEEINYRPLPSDSDGTDVDEENLDGLVENSVGQKDKETCQKLEGSCSIKEYKSKDKRRVSKRKRKSRKILSSDSDSTDIDEKELDDLVNDFWTRKDNETCQDHGERSSRRRCKLASKTDVSERKRTSGCIVILSDDDSSNDSLSNLSYSWLDSPKLKRTKRQHNKPKKCTVVMHQVRVTQQAGTIHNRSECRRQQPPRKTTHQTRTNTTQSLQISGANGLDASFVASPATFHNHQLAEDEVIARQLQEEMDREYAMTLASSHEQAGPVGNNILGRDTISSTSGFPLVRSGTEMTHQSTPASMMESLGQMSQYEWEVHVALATGRDLPECPPSHHIDDYDFVSVELVQYLSQVLPDNDENLQGGSEEWNPVRYITRSQMTSGPSASAILGHSDHRFSPFSRPPRRHIRRQRRPPHYQEVQDPGPDSYEAMLVLTEAIGEVKCRLTVQQINMLPVKTYSEADLKENRIKSCAICMVDYNINDKLRFLPCFHDYHVTCVDKWLKEKASCPVCRAEVVIQSTPS